MGGQEVAASEVKNTVELEQHMFDQSITRVSQDANKRGEQGDFTMWRHNMEVAMPAPASDLVATKLPGRVTEEVDNETRVQGEAEAVTKNVRLQRQQNPLLITDDVGVLSDREQNEELPAEEEASQMCEAIPGNMPSPAKGTEGDEGARTAVIIDLVAHKYQSAVSTSDVTDIFLEYLLNIIHVGVYAMAVSWPALVLLVASPNEGVSTGNLSCFLFYNGPPAVLWAVASWQRLEKLCRRSTDSSCDDGEERSKSDACWLATAKPS